MDASLQSIRGTRILEVLRVLSPSAVATAYAVSSLAHLFTRKKPISAQESKTAGNSLHVTCSAITVLVLATYILESALLTCVLPPYAATSEDHNLAFTLFSSLVWLILLLRALDSASSDIRPVFSSAWIFALIFEIALFVLGILIPELSGGAQATRISCQALRIAFLLVLVGIVLQGGFERRAEKGSDEEIAPLLSRIESHLSAHGAGGPNKNAYGITTVQDSTNGDRTGSSQRKADDEDEYTGDDDEANAENGKLRQDWWVYTKSFAVFLPHLWPRKSFRLQLHFPALGSCVLASRALNVLVPIQLGITVNALQNNLGNVPWLAIGTFIVLLFLDSSAGISLVQSWLWMPINRYTTEQLNAAAYDHIMNLSCDFHDSKKSGRMWQILERGGSLADLVHTICFGMIPMAADLVIAVSVFWWLFDAYMAFIVALSSVIFLWTTAKTLPMRTRRQREFIKAWEDEYSQMTESSLNWTTVSYFNRISYEQNRYKGAVANSQGKLIRFTAFTFIVSAIRALTLKTGLMIAAMLAAYQISEGRRNVGDFVVLITYWAQLTTPLSFFAHGFSEIAESLVNAEKLLELLREEPTVGNDENATEFILRQGQVDFDRVCFSYDRSRQVADNLSFRAEPGQTVALVGETGGGKSTILKLLFRFYDADSGNVMIDGQDVRHVTLESLRANIGCVPQDPVLFNQTILQNLRYAKLDATEEEAQTACRAVALHDKIMSFTKGYAEKVGERGVKLSGGELQRMAIARAILMDPKILLLDEATSNIDSETEAMIQMSLKKLCSGRTTFVVAHRLSTIIHADLVMVIKNGRIIERGTHDKLMRIGGHYSKLWTRQLRLQSGREEFRSRSRSPEKTTVLVDDVTDSDIESRKSLLKRKVHENRGSEEDSEPFGENGGGKKLVGPIMDAKVRGRSPKRNDKTWEKFDKMRHKVLASRSPGRKDEDALQPAASPSRSPTRADLKPDAPEFVPQNMQNEAPLLNDPMGNSQNVGEHCGYRRHATPRRAVVECFSSDAADGQKENFTTFINPPSTLSAPVLPALTEGKTTRSELRVRNKQTRRKIKSANASATRSRTEVSSSEAEPTQRLSESGRPSQKHGSKRLKFGNQEFNSRRNISKSEPQGRNQLDGIDQQQADAQSSSYASLGREGYDEQLARRHSSTPTDAFLSVGVGGQGTNSSLIRGGKTQNVIGYREGGAQAGRAHHRWLSVGRRSSESTNADLDEGNRIVAPANSPITGPMA